MIKKIFRIPGPKELGWSDCDALKLDAFTPFQEGRSWEEYDEYIKKHYPVKYFFVKTIGTFFRRKWGKASRLVYKIKCYVLPSHEFHKIDLRGVDPSNEYTHGYIDPTGAMKLAMWATLRSYIEKHDPVDPLTFATMEEINADPGLLVQKTKYDEAFELHKWWMVGRLEEHRQSMELYQITKDAVKLGEEAYEEACEVWMAYRKQNEEREEEMLMKLLKLRPYLWT